MADGMNYQDAFRIETRLGFAISSPNAHAKISNVTDGYFPVPTDDRIYGLAVIGHIARAAWCAIRRHPLTATYADREVHHCRCGARELSHLAWLMEDLGDG